MLHHDTRAHARHEIQDEAATPISAAGPAAAPQGGAAGLGHPQSQAVAPLFSHFSEDAPVQRRADGGAPHEAQGVRDIARAGLSGPGAELPHRETIQRSFGAHDVSGVRAHTDGPAAAASKQLDAHGFTSAGQVAFAGQPDLFTAAHEAAHVVQQQKGVHLRKGVGESGDAYEQHADAVAARVVQGESAEDLLDQVGPPGQAHAAEPGDDVQRKEVLPQGDKAFDKMWGNHPHNYQDDESQNTTSADLLNEEGLPSWIGNTCAVRLSTMLNRSGFEITPAKVAAAGISRKPTYSKKTGHYYILAASEMWTYLSKNFRKADISFPASGMYKDADSFQAAFDKEIRPLVAARKGIVAFETIFGYGGTGHVDLFNGESLSDSGDWYPCKKLHLWYVSVP